MPNAKRPHQRRSHYPHIMASALCHLGLYAWTLGDFTRARARHEEALGLFRELKDTAGVAAALAILAFKLPR